MTIKPSVVFFKFHLTHGSATMGLIYHQRLKKKVPVPMFFLLLHPPTGKLKSKSCGCCKFFFFCFSVVCFVEAIVVKNQALSLSFLLEQTLIHTETFSRRRASFFSSDFGVVFSVNFGGEKSTTDSSDIKIRVFLPAMKKTRTRARDGKKTSASK